MKPSDYGAALKALRETIQHDDDELMCDIVETGIDKLETINEELLKALRFLVDAANTESGMSIYKAHIEQAEQAIRKAEEQTR